MRFRVHKKCMWGDVDIKISELESELKELRSDLKYHGHAITASFESPKVCECGREVQQASVTWEINGKKTNFPVGSRMKSID